MIRGVIRTIVIMCVLIALMPVFFIFYAISSIEDMFRDPNKPMTKEEYYGWRL